MRGQSVDRYSSTKDEEEKSVFFSSYVFIHYPISETCAAQKNRKCSTVRTPLTLRVEFGLVLVLLGEVVAQEICEGSVLREQVLVGAGLRDAPVHEHHDLIHLRQEADAVRHQHPRLKHEDNDSCKLEMRVECPRTSKRENLLSTYNGEEDITSANPEIPYCQNQKQQH